MGLSVVHSMIQPGDYCQELHAEGKDNNTAADVLEAPLQ